MASSMMASSKPRNPDQSGSPSSTRSRRPTAPTSTSTPPRKQLSQVIQNQQEVKHRLHPQQSPPLDNHISRIPLTVDGMLRNPYDDAAPANDNENSDSTLLDAQITLIEAPIEVAATTTAANNFNTDAGRYNCDSDCNGSVIGYSNGVENVGGGGSGKTVEEVWREIVAGRREMKEEDENEEMMTLEDFLAKAGAVEGGEEGEDEVKMPRSLGGGEVFGFDPMVMGGSGGSGGAQSAFHLLDRVEGAIMGFGNGVEVVGGGGGSGGGAVRGGKRGRAAVAGLMEPLDKVAQQRQRRMIKNRESAARSRERKQAYQVELESQAVRLEEENEQLLKEKEERTKERLQLLMEKVIPVIEKRRPPRPLRRVRSLQW